MDLNEITIFIKVVESGSFSKAAKALGMPNSTVSAKISSLEARLGSTLLQRTTRKLALTPAGDIFFQKCSLALVEIFKAQDEVATGQIEPQGLLRITAPVDLGERLLPEVISKFVKKYPKVKVEAVLLDRKVDLISEGVDLALRVGNLEDSSFIAKKLGLIYFGVMASPKYLKEAGMPKSPRDLSSTHSCIQFTALGVDSWSLTSGRSTMSVTLKSQILSNDLNVVKSLTLAGNGVALLPMFLCAEDVRAGRLIRLFPDWSSNERAVHFVYPAQKYVPPKLSTFIQFASDSLKKTLLDFAD